MAQPDRPLSPMFWYLVIVLAIIFILGIIGFRLFFEVGWIDAAFQTAIATSTLGLSVTSTAETDSQKLFLGIFALLSALLFIGIGTHLVSELIRMYDEKLKNQERESNSLGRVGYFFPVPVGSRVNG